VSGREKPARPAPPVARAFRPDDDARRFAYVSEAVQDAIVVMDGDSCIIEWNAGAERLFGFTRAEVLQRKLSDVAAAPVLDPEADALARATALRNGRWEGELRFARRDGASGLLHSVLVATRGSAGEPTGFVAVHREIAIPNQAQATQEVLFEENPIPLFVIDAETLRFLAVNAAAERQYGYTREEFCGLSITDVRPPEDAAVALARAAAPATVRSQRSGPYRHRRKDGSILLVDIVSRDFTYGDRPARLILAIDVTEQRRLEEQLRHSQKIEAIGQLAGGIAHDFNTLLTVITGHVELALQHLPPSVPLRADLEQVAQAASRAARLTRQLLAFSRKQVLAPTVLELNAVVTDAEQMLRRVIGEDIVFVTELAPAGSWVTADRVQLEQVLLNLVVNARDAMPEGGVLTIATAGVELSEADAAARGVRPGEYATLRVRDTGVGMDDATRSRIFEPFFTTKPVGRGTGLGLSTVYGVVHQSGGFVAVESAPGAGSTFTVFLPRAGHTADGAARAEVISRGGAETILLVEDEREVRAVAGRVLRDAGYAVLEAANAAEAIAAFEAAPQPIALLVTDVVMPGLDGHELSRILRARAPVLRTLFVSGYGVDARGHSSPADDAHFLPKPYHPTELARRVRAILDAGAPRGR
jgi:PAS domain S-box-containing protein